MRDINIEIIEYVDNDEEGSEAILSMLEEGELVIILNKLENLWMQIFKLTKEGGRY